MSNTTATPADCYSTVGTACVLCRLATPTLCQTCSTGYTVNSAGSACVFTGLTSSSAAFVQNMYVALMALVVIVMALFIR